MRRIQYATLTQGGAGDITAVAAVTGKPIKLLSYQITMSLAGTATWKSGSSAISGAMYIPTNGALSAVGAVGAPLLETVAGEALVLTSATGIATGHIAYYTD